MRLACQLGYSRQSRTLARKAGDLKKRFNIDFWMPEKQYIALALDGDGKQCDAVSSNPGLIPNPGVNYVSPNFTGTLTFTPVSNASGTTIITVTVGAKETKTIEFTFKGA